MDYIINFSDVMTAVIGLGIAALGFFIKYWFDGVKKSSEELKNQFMRSNDRLNERVDRLEEDTDEKIAGIVQNINDIKSEFGITFVLRDDYFRAMNALEERYRIMDGKLDRLLIQMKDR